MTAIGALSRLQALFFGDRHSRKITLYMLAMRCRGIDLSGASEESLGLSKERSYRCGNSGGPDLDVVLGTLAISADDAVLDVGCGKGGAMITLAKYPFSRIDGLEISPKLVAMTKKHLHRSGAGRGSIFCCDAAYFSDLDRYTFIYTYNPFPALVFRPFLDNLMQSLARHPRKLTFVYKNAECEDMLLGAGFRKTGEFDHDSPRLFCVYEIDSRNSAAPAT
jgi:SAM-dependent methyltransferase